MSYIARQEALKAQWHVADVHQTYSAWVLCIICVIIGLCVGLILLKHLPPNKKDGFNIATCTFGCSIIGLFVALMALSVIYAGQDVDPVPAIDQNIYIVKGERNLPHLYQLKNKYNREYEYYANRADNNLEKQDSIKKYKTRYESVKAEISHIKSISSRRDVDQWAVTKRGGLHHVKKPTFWSQFTDRTCYFAYNENQKVNAPTFGAE